MPVLDRKELEESPLSDLHAIASELGIEGFRLLRREKLIDQILGESGAPDGGEADGSPEEEERPRRRRSRGGRTRRRRDEDDKDEEPRADVDEAPAAEAEPEAAPAREDEPEEIRSGILDILPNGSGFMRPQPFVHSNEDVYVSPAQ